VGGGGVNLGKGGDNASMDDSASKKKPNQFKMPILQDSKI